MRFRPHNVTLAFLFIAVLAVTAACYQPGLTGGFLFDDEPNLRTLGQFGDVNTWDKFASYIKAGLAEPLGRPISVASFLIDDNTWPSYAPWFKYTNLLLHLLCGVLLAWATLLILRLYGYPERKAQWYAVFSASCWLLHPFLVSTTLYVVQRMAQLSTMFVFLGIVLYLIGRLQLQRRPKHAYPIMGVAITVGTTLAVLSKENGILLPMLIGVIEYCNPRRGQLPYPSKTFIALFIWIPSLLVLVYLATQINFDDNAWPNRNYNQYERLLTQPRIIWDYLGNLYAPGIEGQGLYHDNIQVSTSIRSPSSTLIAIIALAAIAILAATFRHRYSLLSLAVLFYLAGHIIESTILNLELYFEHRNYLPSAFLFLPVASSINRLRPFVHSKTPFFVGAAILITFASLTYLRAGLWGNNEKLHAYWANTAEDSPRAQVTIAAQLASRGLFDESIALLRAASTRMPDNALVTSTLLLRRVEARQAVPTDFETAAATLSVQPLDGQVVRVLRVLVEEILTTERPPAYLTGTLSLFEQLLTTSEYGDFASFIYLSRYLKGRINLAQGLPRIAFSEFSAAIDQQRDVDAAMQMVGLMATAEHFPEALMLLDIAVVTLKRQPDSTLKRSREFYESELERIRSLLDPRVRMAE
jgi:protein O-mannosyl-transferase